MEYRRSVLSGIRLLKRLIAILSLLYLSAAFFGVGPAWLQGRHGSGSLAAALWLELALSFLERKLDDQPPAAWTPSPAISGTITVALTGIAAAALTAWHARDVRDYIVPVAMLASTAVLATLVYRFAARNAGRIGEARFKTPPYLE